MCPYPIAAGSHARAHRPSNGRQILRVGIERSVFDRFQQQWEVVLLFLEWQEADQPLKVPQARPDELRVQYTLLAALDIELQLDTKRLEGIPRLYEPLVFLADVV